MALPAICCGRGRSGIFWVLSRPGESCLKLPACAQTAKSRLGVTNVQQRKKILQWTVTFPSIVQDINRKNERCSTLLFFWAERDELISFHLQIFPGYNWSLFLTLCWSILRGTFPSNLDQIFHTESLHRWNKSGAALKLWKGDRSPSPFLFSWKCIAFRGRGGEGLKVESKIK